MATHAEIPLEKQTRAMSVSGWSICLWGNPKLSVICGNCCNLFKTRDYIKVTNRGGEIAVFCPHCQHYNLTNLFPNN
jgi:hypothetical protein